MATSGIGRQSRMCVILVKVGTPIARAVFEKRVRELTPTYHNPFPWAVDEFLLASKPKIQSLKLHRQTYARIFPTAKLEHWDVELLCYILNECCALRGDIRLFINQLRKLRNKFFHMSEPSIENHKYQHYLAKLKVIFDRCLTEVNDNGFTNEMNKMFEDLEQGHFSQVDVEEVMKQLKSMEEETNEKLTELGQNQKLTNEGIKEIIQQLTVIAEGVKDIKTHSVPATGVEIAVKNCATAQEKEISERLVQYFEEFIRDDVEFPKLPESCQQNIRVAVFKAGKLFLSKGYKITEAEERCVFLRFNFTSLVSLLSFLRECVSGELTLQLQEVEAAVRMLDGCEHATLEVLINTGEVLAALHEIEVTLSSFMESGNILSSSVSSADKNADVKIREVRLVKRKSEDSNEVTNGLQVSLENCSPEYIQRLEESFENGEMNTAMKRIQQAVACEFQITDVSITAQLFQENETVKQEKTSPTNSEENRRKRVVYDYWYQYEYGKLCDTEGRVYWMKAMKALIFAKEAVLPLVTSEFKQFFNNCTANERTHLQHLLRMASNRHTYKQVWRVKAKGHQVKGHNVGPDVWDVNCSDCKPLLQKLLRSHWNPARIEWENIGNVTADDYWKIAQLFMPYGNKDSKGPEDTDMVAIFELLRNFKIDNFGQEMLDLDQLIRSRNELVHSPNNEISEENMNEIFKYILKFLESDKLGQGNTVTVKMELEELQKKAVFSENDQILSQVLLIQRLGLEFDEQEGDRRDEAMEKINKIAEELHIEKFSKDNMETEITELRKLLEVKDNKLVDKNNELETMKKHLEQIEKESPGLVGRILKGAGTGGAVGAFGGMIGAAAGAAGGGVVGGMSYLWDKVSGK